MHASLLFQNVEIPICGQSNFANKLTDTMIPIPGLQKVGDFTKKTVKVAFMMNKMAFGGHDGGRHFCTKVLDGTSLRDV